MSDTRTGAPEDLHIRSRGLLLGAAVGDALGWPQELRSGIVGGARARNAKAQAEFREWERNSGTQFARYRETVRRGEYSDDSQLLLAVARACQRGASWLQHLTAVELPAWIAYQRGGGRAVLAAARSWLKGSPPWRADGAARRDAASYFNAGANGVAMRIAPHVLVSAQEGTSDGLVARVVSDGITTHGHPRALVGAAAHALMLRSALLRSGTLGYGDLLEQLADEPSWRTFNVEDAVPSDWIRAFEDHAHDSALALWKQTADEFQALLDVARRALQRGALADDDATLGELGCFDSKVSGAGTVTAAAAAYVAARSAARPMTGLLKSAFLRNADTDTLASMVGSILGALHGGDWLADLGRSVQDHDYIEGFGGVDGPSVEEHVPQPNLFSNAERSPAREEPPPVTNKEMNRFAQELERASENERGDFVDGRSYVVVERLLLDSRTAATVLRWRLRLDDGQTIIVDRTHRGPRASTRSTATPSSEAQRTSRGGPSTVQGVTLFVDDLPMMANFYRNVVGVAARGTGAGSVELASFLRLRRRDSQSRPRSRVVLEINVPSLDVLRQRLAERTLQEGPGRIEVQDPEGNLIVLSEADPPRGGANELGVRPSDAGRAPFEDGA